jgi:hypothetical protein
VILVTHLDTAHFHPDSCTTGKEVRQNTPSNWSIYLEYCYFTLDSNTGMVFYWHTRMADVSARSGGWLHPNWPSARPTHTLPRALIRICCKSGIRGVRSTCFSVNSLKHTRYEWQPPTSTWKTSLFCSQCIYWYTPRIILWIKQMFRYAALTRWSL